MRITFSMRGRVGWVEYLSYNVFHVKLQHILNNLRPWLQVYYAKEVLADLDKDLKDLRFVTSAFSDGSVTFLLMLLGLSFLVFTF